MEIPWITLSSSPSSSNSETNPLQLLQVQACDCPLLSVDGSGNTNNLFPIASFTTVTPNHILPLSELRSPPSPYRTGFSPHNHHKTLKFTLVPPALSYFASDSNWCRWHGRVRWRSRRGKGHWGLPTGSIGGDGGGAWWGCEIRVELGDWLRECQGATEGGFWS